MGSVMHITRKVWDLPNGILRAEYVVKGYAFFILECGRGGDWLLIMQDFVYAYLGAFMVPLNRVWVLF
jgi:hypothetical protein